MTGTNLSVVKLEGTESRIRKILKDLNGRATVIVRGAPNILYVGIPNGELGWLEKVAKDLGCKKQEVPSLPEHQKTLCGILTTQRRSHEARCKACAALRPPKPKVSAPVTAAKIEPGQDFNLDGVIASIEITHERMFEQLDRLEELLTSLKGYRDAREKLAGLEQEAKDRMQAAKKLLNEENV